LPAAISDAGIRDDAAVFDMPLGFRIIFSTVQRNTDRRKTQYFE